MKSKLLLLFVFLVSTGITVKAQYSGRYDDDGVTFGGKIGFNISNVWDKKGEDFVAKSKVGFAGGLFLGIPIGEFAGIQPEILVSQKGFRGSGTLLGSSYSFSRTSTFVDIPLQLQIRPASFITFLTGPQFSFLIHEKNVYKNEVLTVAQEEAFENDNIRQNILGFVAGVDVNISHLVLSGRLGWDLLNNHGDGTSDTPRYKNSWFQMTVGFRI